MALSRRVGALNFGAECRKLLDEYGKEVHEAIDEVLPDIAETGVKMLRANSKKRTGSYAKDWAKMQVRAWGYGSTYTIYNRKHYRVAHLLENSHPFKDASGRVIAAWTGDEVIKTVEDYLFDMVEQEVKRALG